jgi:hypothetical protein
MRFEPRPHGDDDPFRAISMRLTFASPGIAAIVAVAVLSITFGAAAAEYPNQGAKTAANYVKLFDPVKRHWSTAACSEVAVHWNPRAPDLIALKMKVLIGKSDGGVIVLSSAEDREFDYAVRFHASGATIFDGKLQTVSQLPPFDPVDGGAKSGAPAEILALRLLILARAMAYCESVDLIDSRKLNVAETRQLAGLLFDGYATEVGRKMINTDSVLSKSKSDEGVKYEWQDRDGPIFQATMMPRDRETLQKRYANFRWSQRRFGDVPCPRLDVLLTHLEERGAVRRDGSIAAFGKDGIVSDDSAASSERRMVELCRFRASGRAGSLSISRAAPVRGELFSENKLGTDGTVIRVVRSAEVADSRLFALNGQDWCVTLGFPLKVQNWNESIDIDAIIVSWLEDLHSSSQK